MSSRSRAAPTTITINDDEDRRTSQLRVPSAKRQRTNDTMRAVADEGKRIVKVSEVLLTVVIPSLFDLTKTADRASLVSMSAVFFPTRERVRRMLAETVAPPILENLRVALFGVRNPSATVALSRVKPPPPADREWRVMAEMATLAGIADAKREALRCLPVCSHFAEWLNMFTVACARGWTDVAQTIVSDIKRFVATLPLLAAHDDYAVAQVWVDDAGRSIVSGRPSARKNSGMEIQVVDIVRRYTIACVSTCSQRKDIETASVVLKMLNDACPARNKVYSWATSWGWHNKWTDLVRWISSHMAPYMIVRQFRVTTSTRTLPGSNVELFELAGDILSAVKGTPKWAIAATTRFIDSAVSGPKNAEMGQLLDAIALRVSPALLHASVVDDSYVFFCEVMRMENHPGVIEFIQRSGVTYADLIANDVLCHVLATPQLSVRRWIFSSFPVEAAHIRDATTFGMMVPRLLTLSPEDVREHALFLKEIVEKFEVCAKTLTGVEWRRSEAMDRIWTLFRLDAVAGVFPESWLQSRFPLRSV